ncbi:MULTISPECIES: hypothetical protein [unclassified Bradyrhizobium]|uniref:hypothetical protein n=1 Tax=unclassified Bradyrhizobium TaxID=2631580 RepID=UPI0028ECE5AB|nr:MULTISPECIES: hypothetical protein [unclassified Bradyrhizobium]
MAYQVRLMSSPEREAIIRAAVRASPHRREFYDFRNQKTELPWVRIPEDTLVYRMENFRTYIDQREYIVREQRPADFFLSGQETESVQQLQHEILKKLAEKGVSDSVVPVIDVLRADKQREPLLITFRGVVVNGNRRLAGMRELIDEDQNDPLPEFKHIDCLVLPEDATPNEIVDIEAALQAKPETKLDYDWIGDCLLIERLLSVHGNIDQVARRLNRKPAEIKNSLAALTEANLYLRDWANADGQYSRVVDAAQLFGDIPAQLEGKSPDLTDMSRVIAWNLLENRGRLNQRLYAFNAAFGKRAADVSDRVAESLNISLTPARSQDDPDSFDIDVGEDEDAVSYQPLISAFKDPRTREEAVEALIDVSKAIAESERGLKGGTAALRTITQINNRLRDVEIGAADPSTHAAIDKQLEELIRRANGLRGIIQKLRGEAT